MNRYILLVALVASLGTSSLSGHHTWISRTRVSPAANLDFVLPQYKSPSPHISGPVRI